jgi:exodeoxyribonuclease VII small subunit
MASASKKQKQEKTFEDSFKRLESILEKLESDDCTLEETINLYEEGLGLTRLCYDKLNNAELRIKEISLNTKGEAELKEHK